MNTASSVIKDYLSQALPVLAALEPTQQEQYRYRDRTPNGGWTELSGTRLNSSITFLAHKTLEPIQKEAFSQLVSLHPKLVGAIGVAGWGASHFQQDSTGILPAFMQHIQKKFGTFQLSETQVGEVTKDLVELIESPWVKIRYYTELQHFNADVDKIELTPNLRIRKLTNEEFKSKTSTPAFGMMKFGFSSPFDEPNFIIEGELDAEKFFSIDGSMPDGMHERSQAPIVVRKVILALHTLKAGRLGYEWINYEALGFFPSVGGAEGSFEWSAPFGNYHLTADDVTLFKKLYRSITTCEEPTLTLALQRLNFSEGRNRPEDQLIDAVIGLEALLTPGNELGEVSYRFRMNYASLFDAKEAKQNMQLAKRIYDGRSRIAHGGLLNNDLIQLGKKKYAVTILAEEARTALRKVIQVFLPLAANAPYKSNDFYLDKFYPQSPRS